MDPKAASRTLKSYSGGTLNYDWCLEVNSLPCGEELPGARVWGSGAERPLPDTLLKTGTSHSCTQLFLPREDHHPSSFQEDGCDIQHSCFCWPFPAIRDLQNLPDLVTCGWGCGTVINLSLYC
ncbi:hypothetical protein GN956_G23421 [Arapaima gigas]